MSPEYIKGERGKKKLRVEIMFVMRKGGKSEPEFALLEMRCDSDALKQV